MVRTRFAPSPTGTPESIHLGFVIRALWNYAFAKKNNGQFVLRIEDTDQKRSRKDTEEQIYLTLKEFGIAWDEGPDIGGKYGPYRQSERLEKYKEAAFTLVKKGYAYFDFDAVKREKEEIKSAYESDEKLEELKIRPAARSQNQEEAFKRVEAGEPYVVRVKIPEEKIFEYNDWILRKKIRVLGREVSDLILLKSDGYPTYHLAVVVDDIDMKISHVFRGQEWISTTPIHLYLYEGLENPLPEIGHFSVILDKDTGKKFSKRDMTGKFGVKTWIEQGYLREAVLNYLMLLGWAPKDNREIFSLNDFVEAFDQDGVQKSNPIFDTDKLKWFNGWYIRQKTDEELLSLIKPYFSEITLEIVSLIKDRISTLSQAKEIAGFLFTRPEPMKGLSLEHLNSAFKALQKADWTKESIEKELAVEVQLNSFHRGNFYMDLRLAVCGQKITPPLTESMLILRKDETLARISQSQTQG